MNKTILVTGGNGYIGSHIIVELLAIYDNVIVVDNLSHSDIKTMHKIYEITHKCVSFYNIDLRSDMLRSVFESHAITHVIHLAGLKSVNQSMSDPLEYYDQNVGGSLNLLKLMKEFNVNHIIFSSSAMVYENSSVMLNEHSILAPSNPYGHTKLVVELVLSDMSKNPNFNCTILRYFNPIGNHSSGLLMAFNGENVMPKLCESLINNVPFNIYGLQNQYNAIRDFIHVVDLAKGHMAVLDQKGYHVYNLGTGKGTSILELLKTMENVSGKKINYNFKDKRPGDSEFLVCDPFKIKKELGWQTTYDLTKMCEDVVTALKINNFL